MMTSLQKSHTTAECHKLIHSSVHRNTDYPNSEIKIIIKSLEMQPHNRKLLAQNELIPSSAKPFETIIGNANDSATFDTSLEVKSFSPCSNYISTVCRRRAKPIVDKSELFGNLNKTIHCCPKNDEPKTISAKIQYRKTPVAKRTTNGTRFNENCNVHGSGVQKSASSSMITQIKIPFQNTKNFLDSPVKSGVNKTPSNNTSNLINLSQAIDKNQSFCQKSIIKIQENGKMINYCSNQPFCSTPIKTPGSNQSSAKGKINLMTSLENTLATNESVCDQLPNALSIVEKSINSQNDTLIKETDTFDNNNSFDSSNESKGDNSNDTIKRNHTNRSLVKCFSLTRSSCRHLASTLKSIRNSTNSQSVMSAPNSPKFERHSIFLSSFNNRRTSRSFSKNVEFKGNESDASGSETSPLKLEKSKSSKFLNFFKNRILSSTKICDEPVSPNKIVRNPTFDELNIKLSEDNVEPDDELGCFPLLIKENIDHHNTKYLDDENISIDPTLTWGDQFEFSYICEPSTSDAEVEDLNKNCFNANVSKTPELILTPPSPTHSNVNVYMYGSLQRPPKTHEITAEIRRSISDPSISFIDLIKGKNVNEDLETSANSNDFVDILTQEDIAVTQANVVQLLTLSVSRHYNPFPKGSNNTCLGYCSIQNKNRLNYSGYTLHKFTFFLMTFLHFRPFILLVISLK